MTRLSWVGTGGSFEIKKNGEGQGGLTAVRILSPWGAFVSHQIQSDTHRAPARSGFILRPGALDMSFLLQPFLSEVKKKKKNE